MTKSILNLEGVQILSRNEKKNVNGGLVGGSKSCKIVFRNPDGTTYTKSGTCDTHITGINGLLCEGCPMPSASTESFCNIGNGVAYPLLNGAASNC